MARVDSTVVYCKPEQLIFCFAKYFLVSCSRTEPRIELLVGDVTTYYYRSSAAGELVCDYILWVTESNRFKCMIIILGSFTNSCRTLAFDF